jgi:hypothetical protein
MVIIYTFTRIDVNLKNIIMSFILKLIIYIYIYIYIYIKKNASLTTLKDSLTISLRL